jgi:hypothetical protein
MSHKICVTSGYTIKSVIYNLNCFIADGVVPKDLVAVNEEHGWNEFIRQILIRLHQNQVKHLFKPFTGTTVKAV